MGVLLLLLGLPQVDQGQHQGEEDDDQGPEQERHHHPLRVGLVTERLTLHTPGVSLVLDTVGVQAWPRPRPGQGPHGAHLLGRGHHGHTRLGDKQLTQKMIVMNMISRICMRMKLMMLMRTLLHVHIHGGNVRFRVSNLPGPFFRIFQLVSIYNKTAQQWTRIFITGVKLKTNHSVNICQQS